MKSLVLITSHYPYGTGESFIEAELPWLLQDFNKIMIISQDISGRITRDIPGNVVLRRYDPSTSISGFFSLPVLFVNNFRIIIKLYRSERSFRKDIRHFLSFRQIGHLFKKIIKALQLRDFIRLLLAKESIKGTIVFYSYWLNTGAHAISLLNHKDSIKISRAHGSDLYEEKTKLRFLPLLSFSARALDAVFFISEHGRNYFLEKTGIRDSKLILSRLGTNKPSCGEIVMSEKSDRFTIISCSNLVRLKRIDLLINSLSLLQTGKKILWMHFGDGMLKEELEDLAKNRLGPIGGIEYRFMGQYPNSQLLSFYQTNRIDLFVNTSVTEGIPVSIMEAQSFGIPVIATNTGGVNEIVTEGTGSMLPVDFKPIDLAQIIQYYIELPEPEMNKRKENAYKNWQLNFNATANYEDFVKKVNSILAL